MECHIEVREEERGDDEEEEEEPGSWPQENGRNVAEHCNSERQSGGGQQMEVEAEERGESGEQMRADEASGPESTQEHISKFICG